MLRIIPLILAMLAILCLIPVLGTKARAHDWYEPTCCSGRDCEALPEGAVTQVQHGYHVRYRAKLGLLVDVIVPWAQARPSQNDEYHGCANPVKFLCLYVPMNV